MEILNIENLNFTYPGTSKKALDSVSLKVDSGDFIVVCGESGCGKTTLLKMIKRELSPFGEKSGSIYYKGIELSELEDRVSVSEIGYVFQKPDQQIVTDKVWHELAFGLENLGYSTQAIRRRVGEMASYFGIEGLFNRETNELSGGEKQIINLASVMVMQPQILILDEPTSQLDPIAAADFIATLQKLNKELGLTIILVEHRLEDVFPIADKVAVMEDGRVILYDKPQVVGGELKNINSSHAMISGLPSAVRIFRGVGERFTDLDCPLTVKEGRNFLSQYFSNDKEDTLNLPSYMYNEEKAVEISGGWFRYEKDLPDILRGVDLTVFKGETFFILGGNGTGKTTSLNVIAGLYKLYSGKVYIYNRKKNFDGVTMLPQDPQNVFIKDTVLEDLEDVCNKKGFQSQKMRMIEDVSQKMRIKELLNRHPYDLSGGEQQKCALAKILLLKPEILLLDEPTKGLDAGNKIVLSGILRDLKNEGLTIITVTHDVEFAAENADRCALFFNGEIISTDTPAAFFGGNNFYTTAANRIARHMYKNVVTCEDVIEMALKNGELRVEN